MLSIIVLRVLSRLWKKAIEVSDMLPKRAWNALFVVSVLAFLTSIAGIFLVQSQPEPASTKSSNDSRHALIIGVSNYGHNKLIKGTANDLKTSLHSAGPCWGLVMPSFEHSLNQRGGRGFNIQPIDPIDSTGYWKIGHDMSEFSNQECFGIISIKHNPIAWEFNISNNFEAWWCFYGEAPPAPIKGVNVSVEVELEKL